MILITRLFLYFLLFVVPIFGIMNCDGWNEGSMSVKNCLIDGDIFRAYANFYYDLILISAFLLLIPLAAYIAVSIGFVELLIYIAKLYISKKSKA
jgi:hypothetical protein